VADYTKMVYPQTATQIRQTLPNPNPNLYSLCLGLQRAKTLT